MARNNYFARPLAALLFLLGTAAYADPAAPDAKESDGIVRSVMASTHITFWKLGIGALATRVGPYLDEKEARQHGLHASLSISVEKNPAARQQVAVVVGQTIEVAGYRIKVEAITPGDRGSVSLRLWAAPAPGSPEIPEGIVLSVMSSTQLNFGKLGIGVLATEVGTYLDEKEARQHGLHASLSISVDKNPAAYQQVALVVGQTITVGGYRIKVEHINPGNRGSAVLRLWSPPPEPAKPAKKWPFSWFNLGKD